MTGYPAYHVPRRVLLDLAAAILSGGRRSFRGHALAMLPGITPPLIVMGNANIPVQGPGIITVNHYSRPGFWSPWFTAAVSAMIPQEICWVMTEAFTYPDLRLGKYYSDFSRMLLTRVARVYGFISMPPMPPRPGEEIQRSAAVQRIIATVRADSQLLLGLSPEGGDQPCGILQLPPPGFGKLALALARQGVLFYPVGVFEEEGCFVIRFGEGYRLEINVSDRNAVDMLARRRVMGAIAECLPQRLRGQWS